VIHPTPSKDDRPVWAPPRNLGFDGSRANVAPKRYEPKNIPEHLSRPAVDENKLMQIRANEKAKKANVGKTISLTAKKDGEAQRKKAHELQIQIKKAEKNMRSFFSEVKKIIEKPDEEPIIPELANS
jgi:hypothetical protein